MIRSHQFKIILMIHEILADCRDTSMVVFERLAICTKIQKTCSIFYRKLRKILPGRLQALKNKHKSEDESVETVRHDSSGSRSRISSKLVHSRTYLFCHPRALRCKRARLVRGRLSRTTSRQLPSSPRTRGGSSWTAPVAKKVFCKAHWRSGIETRGTSAPFSALLRFSGRGTPTTTTDTPCRCRSSFYLSASRPPIPRLRSRSDRSAQFPMCSAARSPYSS